MIGFNALMHGHELVSFDSRRSTMAFSHFNIQRIQALLLNFLIILLDLYILKLGLALGSIYLCFLYARQTRLVI